MPSFKKLSVTNRQKSSKLTAEAEDSQKSVATSPKKLRRDNSMKRFVVGPIKKRYDSLKCESGISGASSTLDKSSSSETEESKKSQDEVDIHRGFFV